MYFVCARAMKMMYKRHKSDKIKDSELIESNSKAETSQVERRATKLFTKYIWSYLGNLNTPIKQQLGPDVVLVLVDIVEQAPMRHQLGDQLDGGTQADAQQADQVGVLHARHDEGLLDETDLH